VAVGLDQSWCNAAVKNDAAALSAILPDDLTDVRRDDHWQVVASQSTEIKQQRQLGIGGRSTFARRDFCTQASCAPLGLLTERGELRHTVGRTYGRITRPRVRHWPASKPLG